MNTENDSGRPAADLRDLIGQAISDEIAAGAEQPDWRDSREIDRLADAVLVALRAEQILPPEAAEPELNIIIDDSLPADTAVLSAGDQSVTLTGLSNSSAPQEGSRYIAAPNEFQIEILHAMYRAAQRGESIERMHFDVCAVIDAQRKADPCGTVDAQVALSDEQIIEVWQAMPGGPEGWLKSFGFLQFARAILATRQRAPVAAAVAQGANRWPDEKLVQAVGKLIKAKGRFHTEQNYAAVVAAYDATMAAQRGEKGGA